MTRDEAKKLVMIIVYTYPNFKPQDLSAVVDIWHEMLMDYDYNICAAGLKAYIATDTSGFAPSIGQLIEKMGMISQKEQLNEMEAWALVSKAIRNGYYGAEKEFDNLPILVQKAVGTAGQLRQWALTDRESVENVIQSNFMRTYRTVAKKEREYQKLPEKMKMAIEQKKQNELAQWEPKERRDYDFDSLEKELLGN